MEATSESVGGTGRAKLFGDALLLAIGTFVAAMAVALSIQWLLTLVIGSRPLWLDAFGGLATFLPPLVGAIGAWLLHGHKPSWAMLGGWVGGIVAFGAVMALLVTVASSTAAPREAFPVWLIAVAAIVALVCLGFVALVAFDAVRDLRAKPQAHRTLDTLRLVSSVLLIVLIVVVAFVMVGNPMSEAGEALIFAVMFGIAGGAMALGADVVTSFVDRRHEHHSMTGGTPA
jgi:hypothetical protein